MSIETSIPYSWLKVLPSELASLDAVPLWGSPPPFPWETYTQALKDALHIDHLKITPSNTEWKSQQEIVSGLGANPMILGVNISPLQGKGLWIFPREDLKGLLKKAVSSDEELSDLEKEEWQEEFYEFLAVEAIQSFHKIKYDPSLSPQITRESDIPETGCLCCDLSISTDERQFTGRLVFTPELIQSIRQKYTPRTLSYPDNISQALTLTVQLIAGNVALKREAWKEIQPGDFLLLDSCFLTPEDEKGRILLVVNEVPLFRGKLKDGNIKILEYPTLQEVHAPMIKESDDEDFDTEEETFGDEEFTDEEFTEEGEEEFPEEETEELSEEEGSLEEEEAEVEEHPTPVKAPAAKPAAAPAAPPVQQKAPSQTLVKPDEIPLTISVEVGRVQMSVKQLMELTPGNILELSVHPENGVDLVVSGRCIGKGELLKIGDALGVRILDKA